jgi:hypothetical protein
LWCARYDSSPEEKAKEPSGSAESERRKRKWREGFGVDAMVCVLSFFGMRSLDLVSMLLVSCVSLILLICFESSCLGSWSWSWRLRS